MISFIFPVTVNFPFLSSSNIVEGAPCNDFYFLKNQANLLGFLDGRPQKGVFFFQSAEKFSRQKVGFLRGFNGSPKGVGTGL